MKKVGIITMHRVANCGSALQAYALQKAIQNLGYKSEIIDYLYPNKYHNSLGNYGSNTLKYLLRYLYSRYREWIVSRKFKRFYDKFFVLSSEKYANIEQITANPPQYDVYIAGSDQVWNPNSIGNDTSFMLSFTTSPNKMSYASSFMTQNIPVSYESLYSKYIGQLSMIGVRELSACNVVKRLTGKEATCVLDPTLLLRLNEWECVIKDSKLRVSGDYILVYVLGYSFDVFPYVISLINHLQNVTGYKILIYALSRTKKQYVKNKIEINEITPQNFLYLIKNAKMVVTDSFHATAFSLNFSKQVFPLIKCKDYHDSRVYDLLKLVHAEEKAVYLGQDLNSLDIHNNDYHNVQQQLELLRIDSIHFLNRGINNE